MKQNAQQSTHIPGTLEISHTTPLRSTVWKIRRGLRNVMGGRDVLNPELPGATRRHKARHVYRRVDEFAAAFLPGFVKQTPKKMALAQVRDMIEELDYHVVEKDESKPWGAYYRLSNKQADRFIAEFFPGLTPSEARLGRPDMTLSPKFLLVAPEQRLSWQYHHRRAERWHFMTAGAYFKSETDAMGTRIEAPAGSIVQFGEGERHRLCATPDGYTLVAEIWQHTEPKRASDESDIVRLADDYAR